MHVRVRMFGKPDTIVAVKSKLTKIDEFRRIIHDKLNIEPKLQRLLYGGKLLENGYTFHDYNIKLNDVIQLMVKIQPEENISAKAASSEEAEEAGSSKKENEEAQYKDANSTIYEVGDIIDVIDHELGAWFEGKITRIVYDPSQIVEQECQTSTTVDKENYAVNRPPLETNSDTAKSKSKGIAKYFSEIQKGKRRHQQIANEKSIDETLLFKIKLDDSDDDSETYRKLNEIRPRARTAIDIENLRIGETVMVNYNPDHPAEIGYWHDFKLLELKKNRKSHELIGTLYLGPDSVPQDTVVKVNDVIYKIEKPIPLAQQTDEYKKLMAIEPKKRSYPLRCLSCRDDEDAPCKECGCYLCSKKEPPEEIVLCDECDNGYHMGCIKPPLTEIPEGDWYCPFCKRDPNDVIAPGASKQTKKTSTTNRDWGRGMACVGKTKTCSMPPNHFGPIPGINVGMCWRFRIQVSESGVHRPPVSGIHGRDTEGAYSIVLSGGYEDDYDNGHEFTYTGSGGRDLSGNKRTAEQSCDQTLTRENRALARNCAVPKVSVEGGDAGEKWRDGKPVRVVRSQKMRKHFPKYAPKEGIRYDGIYKVVKYYPEKGLSGYIVWKYLLRRDDPSPAPWEPGAKQYPMMYPDGYLEAEKEKKALQKKQSKAPKGNKRRISEQNKTSSDTEGDTSPLAKRKKVEKGKKGLKESQKSPKKAKPSRSPKKVPVEELSEEIREAISADAVNAKLWAECLTCFDNSGKKEFVQFVMQAYICIICQDVTANPVTTPCLHNFCMTCIKQAFRALGARNCPCCRNELRNYEPEVNELLKAALQCILTGYDLGRV